MNNVTEPETYPTVKCRLCGKTDEAHYSEPTKSDMVKELLCFYCLFWEEYARSSDNPKHARIKGSHYVICNDPVGPGRWKGFGGQRFTIRFTDGRVVETHNLWHQGVIPQHFRDRLPDNAAFEADSVVSGTDNASNPLLSKTLPAPLPPLPVKEEQKALGIPRAAHTKHEPMTEGA